MLRLLYGIVGLCLLLAGCRQQPENEAVPAFYHWKTNFAPSAQSMATVRQLQTRRIYVKYFDVDWSEELQMPTPRAKVQWDSLPEKGMEIVPTIYFTNRTWERLAPNAVDTLGDLVLRLLTQLHPDTASRPVEVQIDSDWSRRTRDTYFLFLRHLREKLAQDGTRLSVTLRLHQVKYRDRSGIPPVDRCMLMLYNTGDLDDPKEVNSILSIEDLRAYLTDMRPYPVVLDAALPIFRWGVLVRAGRPIRLLNQLDLAELHADPRREKTGPSTAKVLESHYLRGHYLYPGDVLRVEALDADQLLECARFAAEVIQPAPRHIAFYHLDNRCLEDHDARTLESLLHSFRHPRTP